MALGDILDRIVGPPRSIRVYSPEPVPELAEHFESTNVTVEHVPLPAADESAFLTVHEGDEFLGGTSLGAANALLDPAMAAPWDETRRETRIDDLLDLLADATFVGFARSQMLAVSREIEDRAWRLDDGELHATFSTDRAVDDQVAVYRQLATREGLAVHIYVADAGDVTSLPGVTIHEVDRDSLDDVWSVAYVGGDPVTATALVGQERDETTGGSSTVGPDRDAEQPTRNGFAGCWTDDLEKVEAVVEAVSGLAD